MKKMSYGKHGSHGSGAKGGVRTTMKPVFGGTARKTSRKTSGR